MAFYSWEGPKWYRPYVLHGPGESCVSGRGVSHPLDSRTLYKSAAGAAPAHLTAWWSYWNVPPFHGPLQAQFIRFPKACCSGWRPPYLLPLPAP